MATDQTDPGESRFGIRFSKAWIVPSFALLCIVLIGILARSVLGDLSELRAARTDSVQWTLSQVESEFLGYQMSLNKAQSGSAEDLRTLRKDFDVFFSRHDIIAHGAVFSGARDQDSFSVADQAIDAYLTETAPFIDGADADLVDALPALIERSEALTPIVRGLYASGLSYFAEANDGLRARLSETLLQLTGATLLLMGLLIVLALYLRNANRHSELRGQKLTRANAHLETILSTSLDGVIVSDRHGNVLDFSAAAEKMFGYKMADILGKNIGELIVPPALREAHAEGMRRMLATGQKKLVGHGRIRIEACRADGSLFPVELALESGMGEDGEIIIAFLRDISAQVEAEQELREARDAALAGEKAKAEFLAVMSHEIRTPLSGLLGNLQLLGGTRLSKEQAQFTGNMDISGRQLMGHVNAILDIAKFESGRVAVRDETFHLARLVQEIVDAQSSQAENRNTAMSWQWMGPAMDWVQSDRDHIQQILMNLVGNAIKFTENGRIDIELEQIGDETGVPLVEFRIIDTGIGIAEGDLERIFEDFETSARPGGMIDSTGLGLGIAKRLVGLLDGSIGVESTLGEGSVFWVRLPLVKGARPVSIDSDTERDETLRQLEILLVEDNDMNAFVVEKMLKNEGHNVTWAQDGLEAIDWAHKAMFDVILMDINMPRLGGLEATKRIRDEIPQAQDTPIFAFSANVLPEETEKFRQNGMDGFIGKPVQIDEMRAALGSAVFGRDVVVGKAAPQSEAQLMLGDNYEPFLERFLGEADELSEWLSVDAPRDEVVARCHKISSTASMFGAKGYHTALAALERAGKTEGAPDLTDLIAEAKAAWDKDRAALVG